MHYFLFGKGVISEFSYSLDNREDTNLTLYELVSLPKRCWTFSKFLALHISPTWTSIKHCVISFALFDARWAR
jgi:hypothetical protein